MRAVLVTGGAGYIGAHACKALRDAGFLPVTFDNLSNGWRDAVRFGPLVEGDLFDRAALDAAFARYRPVAVMHFAALSLVGEAMRDPGKYWRANVLGSLNLIEAAVNAGCLHFVFSSTCATYGDQDGVVLDEDTPQRPINSYGKSKRAIEDMLADFGASHGLRSVIFRYFNVAGADPDAEVGEFHQPETHLIPLMLDAIDGKRPALTVFGTDYPTPDGTCIRDYVHVSDLADAHVLGVNWLLESKGKARNVLIITLEGIPGAYVATSRAALSSNYPMDPMPRLSQWATQAMTVPDYVLHSHQTIRGLYSMLCGDYSKLDSGTPKGLELLNNPQRAAQCLPAQLHAAGYSTHFLQGAGLRFMAKDRIMPKMGFDKTLGRNWFTKKPYLDFPWGMDDKAFFEGSITYVQQLRKQKKPWMLTLMTVGTHQPYSAPEAYLQRYPDGKTAAIAYLDDALDYFMSALQRQGVLKDTLVIITSDESHGIEKQRLARVEAQEGLPVAGDAGAAFRRQAQHQGGAAFRVAQMQQQALAQELHRLDRIQLSQELAEDPDTLGDVAAEQQLFLAGP